MSYLDTWDIWVVVAGYSMAIGFGATAGIVLFFGLAQALEWFLKLRFKKD